MQVALSINPNDDHVKSESKIQEKVQIRTKQPDPAPQDRASTSKESAQELEQLPTEGNVSLKFKQDHDTGRLVVEMIDEKTGDAIRQIPTEASLRLSAVIGKIQAKFVDKQV